MKVTIDQDGCIGCGLCADICPEVFAMNDDGVAEVIAEVTADTEDCTQEAADSCPVSVIHIEE
ncbi:MAG: ferredoxin [Tissierellales bacterium]